MKKSLRNVEKGGNFCLKNLTVIRGTFSLSPAPCNFIISLSAISTVSNEFCGDDVGKAAPAKKGDTATVGYPDGGIYV